MTGGDLSDDAVHDWSLRRAVVATAVIGLVAASIGVSLPGLLGGRAPLIRTGEGMSFAVFYGALFTAFSVFLDRRRPSRIRFSAEGVELRAARRDGVFVPWSAGPTARVRWVWPLATLQVTVPASLGVIRQPRGGRAPSVRRRKDGALRISMPLTGLAASPASIQAEFDRRSAAAPRDSPN